jgi:hypothetical protein
MRPHMQRTLKTGLPLLLLAFTAAAQQTSQPLLRSRQSGSAPNRSQSDASPPGAPSTLPADVWGTYHFDHLNESIELDLEHGKVTGYITRLGDSETDSNTPLTYFFDKGAVHGSHVEFQTRVVHGIWYAFYGTIVRGEAETRDDDGYYVLHGTLYTHHPAAGDEKSADETVESRPVNFKSMGS